MDKKETELDRLRIKVEEQAKEIDIMNEELTTAKDANSRAPTTTMKNMVERLKNQLALKEKQHQVYIEGLNSCLFVFLFVSTIFNEKALYYTSQSSIRPSKMVLLIFLFLRVLSDSISLRKSFMFASLGK